MDIKNKKGNVPGKLLKIVLKDFVLRNREDFMSITATGSGSPASSSAAQVDCERERKKELVSRYTHLFKERDTLGFRIVALQNKLDRVSTIAGDCSRKIESVAVDIEAAKCFARLFKSAHELGLGQYNQPDNLVFDLIKEDGRGEMLSEVIVPGSSENPEMSEETLVDERELVNWKYFEAEEISKMIDLLSEENKIRQKNASNLTNKLSVTRGSLSLLNEELNSLRDKLNRVYRIAEFYKKGYRSDR